MKKELWEVKIKFNENTVVTRRIASGQLTVGSTHRANLKLLGADPADFIEISLLEANDKLSFKIHGRGFELMQKGEWVKAEDLVCEQMPALRFGRQSLEIGLVQNHRQSQRFEPETWVQSFASFEDNCHALWHFRDGLLCESVLLDGHYAPVHLKSGNVLVWNPKEDPSTLTLREHNGDVHALQVGEGRHLALRAIYQNEIFIITQVPNKKLLSDLAEPLVKINEGTRIHKIIPALLATLLLLGSLAQLFQASEKAPEVVVAEELSPEMAKIVMEAPKGKMGGNGSEGGGGVETEQFDRRGGAGLAAVDKLLKQKVTAAGTPDKGGVLGALSALDEGMKKGKINVAGIMPASTGQQVMGSVAGVLGALTKNAGSGKGGGGVGIGGIGTKGFGGGGGGGTGNGFGTGVGAGLGKGKGARDVIFESENSVIQGGLDRAEVDAVVQENISQIRFCYNRGLRANPGMQGKVITMFTIGPEGGVKTSRVKDSTLSAPDVEDCIKGRVAMWKFPKPRGGGEVTVNYPFLLKSN